MDNLYRSLYRADCRHTLGYRSTNMAGNIEPADAISFGADTAPPILAVITPQPITATLGAQ